MLALACAGPAAAEQDAPHWYRAALAAMQGIREPAYLTYRTQVPAGDATLAVSRDELGRAEISVLDGPSGAQAWDVVYRAADGTAAMTLADGTRTVSHLAIFDPTWRGAFTWLRHGLTADVAPSSTPSPAGTTSEGSPENAPPIVAIVTAINENAYDLKDGGNASCADGRSGRRVWTVAKSDPQDHPLVGAVIDASTLRFCTMEFRQHVPGPPVTFDLDVELNFGDVGPYYLITGGTLDGAIRPYRRPGWFRLQTTFRYDRFTFPSSPPAALFTPGPGDADGDGAGEGEGAALGAGVPASRASGACEGKAMSSYVTSAMTLNVMNTACCVCEYVPWTITQ
ncbi:MAG TPA: hypothetical protein VMF61_08110 [Candidatus Acidoferrales bacterium]|nr:hypothetical protein [Candidatus Acidoferrales bacterium]